MQNFTSKQGCERAAYMLEHMENGINASVETQCVPAARIHNLVKDQSTGRK
jgi:hypothetical protein